jgi:hypothetical protein
MIALLHVITLTSITYDQRCLGCYSTSMSARSIAGGSRGRVSSQSQSDLAICSESWSGETYPDKRSRGEAREGIWGKSYSQSRSREW